MKSWSSFFSKGNSETNVGGPKSIPEGSSKRELKKCFFENNTNYKYTNVYEEADDMLQAACIIYTFTFLRNLAREGKLTKDILTLPLTLPKVVSFLEENANVLQEYLIKEEYEMTKRALQSIQERFVNFQEEISNDDGSIEVTFTSSDKKDELPIVIAYGDENNEEELVYAIAIHKARQRITLAFRGSVTKKDFLTDACVSMRRFDNPVYGKDDDQDENIKLHSGFCDYLLKDVGRIKRSKFDEITCILLELFQQYPSFQLYVTGHSLGGALATLFAFEAATKPSTSAIPKPISCISVASPKVGNESWRKAFQYLEENGAVRHLRIANNYDPVTLGPPASTSKMLMYLSPAAHVVSVVSKAAVIDEIYTHVGIKLKLTAEASKSVIHDAKDVRYHFSYATGNWRQDFLWPGSFTTPQNHFVDSYTSRVLVLKEKLSQVYLNDLYLKREELSHLVPTDEENVERKE